ncbi:hypothetical protein, partial [Streptococcus anginosus]
HAPIQPGRLNRFEELPTPDRPIPNLIRVTLEWTVRPARTGRRQSRTIRVDDGLLALVDATRPEAPMPA